MKIRLNSLLWIAGAIFLMYGCSGSSRSYDSGDYDDDSDEKVERLGGLFGHDSQADGDQERDAPELAAIPKFSDRACFGLYGPVKTVEQDGRLLVAFDQNGMMQKFDYYDRYVIYKRDATDLYSCDIRGADYFTPLRITLRNDEREDIDTEGNGDFVHYKWKFDDAGRLISKWSSIEFYTTIKTYKYHGDDRLPYNITASGGEGGGGSDSSETYTYIDIDRYGNWTKAKISGHYESSDDLDDPAATKIDESSAVVTRRITYYD